MFWKEKNKLLYKYDDELLLIEPYGKDILRVRSTKLNEFPNNYGALIPKNYDFLETEIEINDKTASIKNGDIKATITHRKNIIFTNSQNEVLLEEYIRQRAVTRD